MRTKANLQAKKFSIFIYKINLLKNRYKSRKHYLSRTRR